VLRDQTGDHVDIVPARRLPPAPAVSGG
jgi:hypothetical protein